MATRNQLFRPSITQKPGIFQPVTGQAVVVVTTAVDQAHADEMKRSMTSKGGKKVYNNTAHVDVVRRVESHLVALKKKGRNRRQFRGTGADLKIFTAINGLNRDELIENYEHVGVVQTPISESRRFLHPLFNAALGLPCDFLQIPTTKPSQRASRQMLRESAAP